MLGLIGALLAIQTMEPWKQDWPAEMLWARVTTNQERFWIRSKDYKPGVSRGFTVWLHGDHSQNSAVSYRSSVWRIYFNCDGTMTLSASTTIDPDGRSKSWDGYQNSYIRPGTMYEDIEQKFCPKN